MGLLDMLSQNGSQFSIGNGSTPAINPLATDQSLLHAEASGQPGYSLNGANLTIVAAQYSQYNDGVANVLPAPSTLDTNGITPPSYEDNLPN
jgi:hypothetical protein